MATPVASTSLSAGNVVASARKAKPAGKQLGTLVVVVIKAVSDAFRSYCASSQTG